MRYLYFAVLFGIVIISPAAAYLDPGTGSMIVSAIIGVVAAAAYVFKGVIFKFLKIFKNKNKDAKDISEDGK